MCTIQSNEILIAEYRDGTYVIQFVCFSEKFQFSLEFTMQYVPSTFMQEKSLYRQGVLIIFSKISIGECMGFAFHSDWDFDILKIYR